MVQQARAMTDAAFEQLALDDSRRQVGTVAGNAPEKARQTFQHNAVADLLARQLGTTSGSSMSVSIRAMSTDGIRATSFRMCS
ncbi:MAG: hypothetical protein U0531_18525 [Dehalococcoidia bacterium]